MPKALPAGKKPHNVKQFTVAFLVLALLMVAAQVINFIITLLPSSQDAVLEVGDGTTIPVAVLQDSYLTLVIFVLLIYGMIWFWVRRSKNWARWVAVVLAVLAAVAGAQGLITTVSAGATDMIGLAMSLAQVIAAGWVLALAFRPDLHEWFKTNSRNAATS